MRSVPVGPPALGQRAFLYDGREVYRWHQTLGEVVIATTVPPGVRGKMIDCTVTATHLRLGLKGNRPFIDEALGGTVVTGDTVWTVEDGTLTLNLTKARKGETWAAALRGHGELDPVAASEVQRHMLLER
jgi:hypothetical protein